MINTFLKEAKELQKNNKIKEAENVYLKALEIYPYNPEITKNLNSLRVNYHHILKSNRYKLLLTGAASINSMWGIIFRNIADVIYLKTYIDIDIDKPFYMESSEIVYDYKKHDLISVLSFLPQNWEIDYIIVINPEINTYIKGIEYSEYPIISMITDYIHFSQKLIIDFKHFDYILCISNTSLQKFKDLGFKNVFYLKGGGLAGSTLLREYINLPKIIDVSFTGSFDSPLYTKRAKYLKRLLKLSDKFKIYIGNNLDYKEFSSLFSLSKLTFNCANCQNNANYRVFETIDHGGTLFMESDNEVIREFFEDKQEVILYNDLNFEELIEYYVNHDEEREKINNKAREKSRQNYTYENLFKQILDKIQSQNLSIKDRQILLENKYRKLIDQINIDYYLIVYNKMYDNQQILFMLFNIITMYEKILKDEQNQYILEILNNLIVCYFLLCIYTGFKNNYLSKIIEYFNRIYIKEPNFIITRINLLLFNFYYFKKLDFSEVKNIKELLKDKTNKTLDKGLFFYPETNDEYFNMLLRLKWETIVLNFPKKDDNYYESLRNIFFWIIHRMCGDYNYKNGKYDEALEDYKNSIIYINDDPYIYYKIGKLLFKKGHFHKAVSNFQLSINYRPFYLKALIYHVKSLFFSERSQELIEYSLDSIYTNIVDKSFNYVFMYYLILGYLLQNNYEKVNKYLNEFFGIIPDNISKIKYIPEKIKNYLYYKNNIDNDFNIEFSYSDFFKILIEINNINNSYKLDDIILKYIKTFKPDDKITLIIRLEKDNLRDNIIKRINNIVNNLNLTLEKIPDILIYDEFIKPSTEFKIFKKIDAYIPISLQEMESNIFLAYVYNKRIVNDYQSINL